ncbi:putative alpha/beta superfamily hydrolase [Chitinophaga sp. W3I9]|uniref:alpha/beta hydrolase-fold protein n=1 Tax=Chitinophaga sp. W3I9 TaxID=3373924 RepID=UPI003D238C48
MRLFFCFLFLVTISVEAQHTTSTKDSIYSNRLGELRKIEIILPDNYAADTTHYDVWYVIDGEWNTHTFTNIFNFLVAIKFAPQAIIVNVPNRYVNGFNLRDRDFTPIQSKDVDSSGGADKFLAFFEKELMPYINRKYRVSSESGLFGTSLGGVFAFYTLLQRPDLFRFYTLGDPAFQFGDRYLVRMAAQKLKSVQFRNTALNIGGRSGFSYGDMARDAMDSILKANAPSGLHWHSALYDNETHGSSVFKSNYDGLKYAYLGYYVRNARYQPTGGIVVKGRSIRLFLPTDNAEIRYTQDGSLPNRNSALVDDHLITDDPSGIRAISFSPGGRYDHELPMNLRTGNYLTPEKMLRTTRQLPKLDLQSKPVDGQLTGAVAIPRDGYYVFQLTPSEGTQLYLNDSLRIQYNPADGHARQTVILPLRKGNYILKLLHPAKKADDPSLNFGLYYSENGQDDWWRNPLVKW